MKPDLYRGACCLLLAALTLVSGFQTRASAETISLDDLNMRAWALSEDGTTLVMSITPPETAKPPRLLISTDDSFTTFRELDFPSERVVIGMDFSRDGQKLALGTLCVADSCGPMNESSVLAEYDIETGELTDLTTPDKALLQWKPHYAVDGELYFGLTEMEGNSLARSLSLGHAAVARLDRESGQAEIISPYETKIRQMEMDSPHRPGLAAVWSPGITLSLISIIRMDGDRGLLHAHPRNGFREMFFKRGRPTESQYGLAPTDPRTRQFTLDLCAYANRVQQHQEAIGGLSDRENCIPPQPPGNILSFGPDGIELVDLPIYEFYMRTDGIANLGEHPTNAATAYDDGRKVLLAIEEWGDGEGMALSVLEKGTLVEGPALPPNTDFVSRPEISNDGETLIFLDNYRVSSEIISPEIWLRRDGAYSRMTEITIVEGE